MDQQNWATKLLGYRFDIIYKTSLENKGANVLSRMYEEGELKAMAHHPIWPEGKAVLCLSSCLTRTGWYLDFMSSLEK